MNTHKISSNFISGLSFTAKIDQYHVEMDTTDENTQNLGPSPKKLMLASLAGCTGIDVVSILNKMKVNFSDLKIDIHASLTEEHPQIYNEVFIHYFIKVREEDQAKVQKAVDLSKDKYCGVSAMFQSFAKLNWKINFL
jgi:putative redox protein